MSSVLDQTADPFSQALSARSGPATEAIAVLLFHADLTRVGETYVFLPGAASLAVLFGRGNPSLAHRGVPTRALDDPCISRSQVTIGWFPDRGCFSVRVDPDARRPVRVLDVSGGELPIGDVAPGALVAIGDRALLWLDTRPHLPTHDALGMVGESRATANLRARIFAVADSPQTVLVRGETGVGKELVARAVHDASARHRGPFIAVNCAALPEALLESELFGHARGAFSGASVAKDGLFAAASHGTLFLDEIGELPLPMQAKLLRALQLSAIRPVGANNEVPIDVRVVVATNRDLARESAEGRFRGDLYARVEGLAIDVPPVRERREDVPLLFVGALAAQLADAARRPFFRVADTFPPPVPMTLFLAMLAYSWPRNVREIEKYASAVIAATRARGSFEAPPLVEASRETGTLPEGRRETRPETPPTETAKARPDEERIRRALEEADYVQHRAARALGVSHTTLDRWLRELSIVRPKDLSEEQIANAAAKTGGNVEAMAKLLCVGVRGLKLRMAE